MVLPRLTNAWKQAMNEAHVRNSTTFNDDRDVMVFVRTPKTGSTSFAQMFQSAVGPDRWAHLPDWRLDTWDMGFQRAHDQLRRFGMRVERDVRRLGCRVAGQRDRYGAAQFLHGHFPLWAPLPTRRHAYHVSLVRDQSTGSSRSTSISAARRKREALDADIRLLDYVQENRDRLLDTTRLA